MASDKGRLQINKQVGMNITMLLNERGAQLHVVFGPVLQYDLWIFSIDRTAAIKEGLIVI